MTKSWLPLVIFSNWIRLLPNPGVPEDPLRDDVGDDLDEESIELVELTCNPPIWISRDFEEKAVMLCSAGQPKALSKIEFDLH